MKNRKLGMILAGLFLFVLAAASITGAQAEKNLPYVDAFYPDTEILELEPGEEYSFKVIYEPEDTMFDFLNWVSSDSTIVMMEGNTAKALAPGKALLYAETFDHQHTHIIHVTVKGDPEQYRPETNGEASFPSLIEADLAKIQDPGFLSYLQFQRQLGDREGIGRTGAMDHPSYALYFDVARENHAEFIRSAEALGLTEISEFKYSDALAVTGSAEKLAALLAGNNAVQAVRTDEMLFIVDPEIPESAKSISLEGNADALSNFSAAHAAGLNGDGAVVAILDTGILASHEFFKNSDGSSRVAYQQCYSTTSAGSTASVCKDGASAAAGDAYPYLPDDVSADLLYEFSHGSHVAGIAAGNGGVAPRAEIAMVAALSLVYKDGEPYSLTSYNSDLQLGLEKILAWYDSGINITSLNLSLGSYEKGSTSDCDSTYPEFFNLFKEMQNRGIRVSVSAGNERYYSNYEAGRIDWPACYSNVTAVGALTDSAVPEVAFFSCHGQGVDLLAPGWNIKSAVISGNNSYGIMSGTSQAAPIVAGAFALTAGHLYLNDGEDLQDALIAMSEKSAAADNITKPVLDLTHVAEYRIARPSNLQVAFTEESGILSAVLSWDPAADAKGYEFRYKKYTDTEWVTVDNGTNLQYTLAGVDPEQAYQAEVRAWQTNPEDSSRQYSGFVKLSFLKNLHCPEITDTAAFGNAIFLAWASYFPADHFTVSYRESGTADWTSEDTTNTSRTYSAGIENGKTYEVKVGAWFGDREAESEIKTITAAAKLWPSDAAVTLEPCDYQWATLEWTAVPDAAGYRVSRRKASESRWRDEQIVTDTKLRYSDLDGSEMVFRVCAMFASGSEACSSLSLPELPTTAKTILDFEIKLTAEAGVVTFSWPAVPDSDGYRLSMYDADSGKWVEMNTVTTNSNSISFGSTPPAALQFGIAPVKVFQGLTLVPDEKLTFTLTPDMLVHTESRTVSWNLEAINPQPPTFFLLESPYRDAVRQLPETGFAAGSALGQELRASFQNFRPTGYTLQIPSLNLAAEVVEVPFDDGQYPVAALENRAGLLEGAALPGKGISVLTGHNHLSASESGPFLFIRDLTAGDLLFVTDPAGALKNFSVYENLLTTPDDLASIEAELRENTLVLITCENETAEGGYANRRVILAEPRETGKQQR